MAFENLSESFQKLFKKIRGQARLNESNIEEILKDIKVALLDADVNNIVIKDFLNNCKEKMIGEEVIGKLNPSQLVVKIVNDEIINLLGKDIVPLDFAKQSTTIMMLVGLQGGGKTTMASKLSNYLRTKENKKVMMIACDVYRPGAIEQLIQLGKQAQVFVYSEPNNKNVLEIACNGVNYAKYNGYDVALIDTAGRLSIDEELMNELVSLKDTLHPKETLIIVDAMSGQEAVNVTKTFDEKLGLTGALMSKLDGDARGGAALSIAYLSNIHIKFIGLGEKVKDIQLFDPVRMANRILGMGDVVELVEKAQEAISEQDARKLATKMMSGKFDLNDMLKQIEATRKMGPLGVIAKLIPGMPKISSSQQEEAELKMKKTRSVIQSMTLKERKNPDILKAERKIRIAKGSGMQVSDVNVVLKQYDQMKLQMKQMSSMFGGRFKF